MNKKIKKVLNSSYWKANINERNIKTLDFILKDLEKVTMPNIKQLSNLFLNESIDNVVKYFQEYNKLTPIEKRSRNLRNFILFYGNKKGKEKYKKYKSTLKGRVSLKGFIQRHGEKNGIIKYNEYKKKLSESGKNRVKREGSSKQKERSHFCKEFWLKRGLSKEDATIKIKEIQSNNGKKERVKKAKKS